MEYRCLFCDSYGPFNSEHIIPESLGNDNLILEREVCAECNNHFAKIEEFVLQKTDFAIWRALLGIRTKKGGLPSVNLSKPTKQKGQYPSRHPSHSDGLTFTAHEDESTSVDIDDPEVIKSLQGKRSGKFTFVMTPKVLFMMGRFLCKVGVEMVCDSDRVLARDSKFKLARDFARHGTSNEIWPIFYYSDGSLEELREIRYDGNKLVEDVECYQFSLLDYRGKCVLFRLKVGISAWVVCLNDKWPNPEIKAAFSEKDLQLIWYSPESIRSRSGLS